MKHRYTHGNKLPRNYTRSRLHEDAAKNVVVLLTAAEKEARRKELYLVLKNASDRVQEAWTACVVDPLSSEHFRVYELWLEEYRRAGDACYPEYANHYKLIRQREKLLYPLGFSQAILQLSQGYTQGLEIGIRFLEADPWM